MVKEIEDGINLANTQRESFKKKLKDMQNQLDQFKDEKLYTEVTPVTLEITLFQNRSSSHCRGRHEREGLVNVLKTEDGITL